MNRPQNNANGQQRARDLAPAADLKMIITGEDAAAVEKLDAVANTIGKELFVEKLTTSQIRNVFGEVRTIELAVKSDTNSDLAGNYRRLIMLKPKLAYQVGRETKSTKRLPIEILATILTDSINLVDNNKIYFGNFVNFFEAILAYHRYYGGRNFSG